MSELAEAYAEYAKSLKAHKRAIASGFVPPHITARRIAALRRIHRLEDPWQPCPCACCERGAL